MKTKQTTIPVFKSESAEADWWASPAGREFVRQKSAEPVGKSEGLKGSPLAAGLNRGGSVQIALRLPEADLAETRRIAARKGIGYQTLLKMVVHEGFGGKRGGDEGEVE